MNLSDINWDINAAGTWPLPFKIATALLICCLVAGGWVYYDTMEQFDALDKLESEEKTLKASFETKQKKAANLQDYRDQLKQIEASLGEMLRQMPTKAEVANLLVDISQTGLASGLEFRLFKPRAEINRDFYMELPIGIQVVGQYEELGLFVSGLASLTRLVTVHNINIDPVRGSNKMQMSATVTTYNEGERSMEAGSKKMEKAGRRRKK
ncbi:MAG: type 4a pilus biogenesis protein PilO [Gammaproteobacteria bacterium]